MPQTAICSIVERFPDDTDNHWQQYSFHLGLGLQTSICNKQSTGHQFEHT